MPKTVSSLTTQIKQAMTGSGLSIYRIAVDTGIPVSTVHRFFKDGKSLYLSNAEKIMARLGFTITAPTFPASKSKPARKPAKRS